MPWIDLIDETWIAATPPVVATHVSDPANWRRWWPELRYQVDEVRGLLGVRWWVAASGRHQLGGSMEIWLEPSLEGTILHYFLRLDPVGATLTPRQARRTTKAHALRSKRNFFALKDDLERVVATQVASSHA